MSNRLEYEDSPYLQQHQENPFDWYAWGDEAFERARELNRPIFISIGYSACHWCHVMEREVFENRPLADFMNRHFVCIKVDREERPDIDKHYQELHMLLNRRPGGWPMSIFATPQNRAIFAQTYISLERRDRSMGFVELSEIIAKKVEDNDKKLFQNAKEIETFLKQKAHPQEATRLTFEISKTFLKQCRHNFEDEFGGFSQQPKFPHTSTLNSLMNLHYFTKEKDSFEMVSKTLSAMQSGGMYDVVDGGFCRYSVDKMWLVPHFEKMTYDNALLCELYTNAFHLYGDVTFKRTAIEIADFMLAKMSERALFYSSSDADSDGAEGSYFVYEYDNTLSLLIDAGFAQSDSEEILGVLNITPKGNFEGLSIVRIDDNSREPWFEKVRSILKSIRDDRSYPFIDRKVQTSWNSMMIKALFCLSYVDNRYKKYAIDSLEKVLKELLIDDVLYHTKLINKSPKVEAFLEDYAYLGVALIAAYESTFDERYLILAQKMANRALELYYDSGSWYFSRGEFETKAQIVDSSYPGSVGVVVDLLLSLGSLVEHKYDHFAFKTLEYYSYDLARKPINSPYLFDQLVRYLKEDRVIKSRDSLGYINYPYNKRSYDVDAVSYTICGKRGCFATTEDANEIDRLIANSID